ncbi:MAG: hypothetical protein GY703_24760 [Gammaproteobacteria bacterium]|nr:hypothetical protein [Gammaproteobacteria bacterium]
MLKLGRQISNVMTSLMKELFGREGAMFRPHKWREPGSVYRNFGMSQAAAAAANFWFKTKECDWGSLRTDTLINLTISSIDRASIKESMPGKENEALRAVAVYEKYVAQRSTLPNYNMDDVASGLAHRFLLSFTDQPALHPSSVVCLCDLCCVLGIPEQTMCDMTTSIRCLDGVQKCNEAMHAALLRRDADADDAADVISLEVLDAMTRCIIDGEVLLPVKYRGRVTRLYRANDHVIEAVAKHLWRVLCPIDQAKETVTPSHQRVACCITGWRVVNTLIDQALKYVTNPPQHADEERDCKLETEALQQGIGIASDAIMQYLQTIHPAMTVSKEAWNLLTAEVDGAKFMETAKQKRAARPDLVARAKKMQERAALKRSRNAPLRGSAKRQCVDDTGSDSDDFSWTDPEDSDGMEITECFDSEFESDENDGE